MPQSGLNFAGYSQVGSAGGTGSPFAPPPPTPSFPSSHQQQQVQGFGPTAAAPHHMQQQHMQHHHNQQQQQQPASGGWVAGVNQNVSNNINNGLTPPKSGDTVMAAPSQLPSSYSPSPPSTWGQSHVQPPPPKQQQQQQNHHHQLQQMAQVQRFGPTAAVPHHMHQQHMQQHTEQNQISKPPIRLVAVDEGAIHKQAQDFLMAMTVIQASAHSLPFHRTLLLPRPRACDASLVLRLSLSPFANNWWGKL